MYNFTSFDLLQQQMQRRKPRPPDFIPRKNAWPTNTSSTAPNCTSGAETVLDTTNEQLEQTKLSMNRMKASTHNMCVPLFSLIVLSFLLLLVVFVFPASGGVSKRRGERVFYMSFPSRLLLCVFFVSSLCLLSSRVGSALTLVCAKFSR